jgi:succinyl-CoA synthetase alpha subunit
LNSVQESITNEGVNTTLTFVQPMLAAKSIMDCIESKTKLVVCMTEGIPVHDTVKVNAQLEHFDTHLIDPNCPCMISPSHKCKIGIMSAYIHRPDPIGIVSRSGTLTYEAV